MRTTIIPAQITTVEDKIAGNLNITQIILLLIPVIWATIIYTIFPSRFNLNWYKFPMSIFILILCLTLSIRFKGKVMINWLVLLLQYNLRPKYYIFNKNDLYQRQILLTESNKNNFKISKKSSNENVFKKTNRKVGAKNFIGFKKLLNNPNYSLSFKVNKKGGLNVAFEQIKK